MARGAQKLQSQQKNQKRQEQAKKAQGCDQKAAAQKALLHKCPVCLAQMPDPKTFKQRLEISIEVDRNHVYNENVFGDACHRGCRSHFENKHPKSPLPAELVDVQV